MKPKLQIEFLFWDDCPSHPKAWERLQEALLRTGREAEIRRVELKTEEEAERTGFPGSPTIRINGHDIDPDGARGQPLGLTCRIYRDAKGRGIPVPSEALIREAILKAAQGESL